MLKQISKNITSNFTGYFVSLVVGLLLSPFVVHSLGAVSFGFWTLIRSLTGYYGLLDLGILAGVSQFVTRYLSKDDSAGVNRTFSTAFFLLSGVACILICLTIFLSITLSHWVSSLDQNANDLRLALLMTGFAVALNFPLVVFKAIPYGLQRLELLNALTIFNRILEAVLVVWALQSKWGIVGLAGANCLVGIIGGLIQVFLAFHLYPNLKISHRYFSKDSLREIRGYGIHSFFITAADRILLHTDYLIVGFILTAEAVTYYAIGASLVPYYLGLIQAVTWALTPYAIERDAHGDKVAIKRLLLFGTRGTVALAAFFAGGMIVLGHDFLMLWMGPKYVSGETFISSGTILSILTVATFIRLTQSCGFQILCGMQKVQKLSWLALIESGINLTLSIVLTHIMGLIGVALGTLLSIFVIRGVLQPLFLIKTVGLSWGEYMTEIGMGSIPLLGTFFLVNWMVGDLFPVHSWIDFFVKGGVFLIPTCLMGIFSLAVSREGKVIYSAFMKRAL